MLRQEYIASCERRGKEIDGVSDNPVSLFVGDYESPEAARADLQKREKLHHKGTSALFAMTSYGSLVLGFICLHNPNAFEAEFSEPSRAAYS